MADDDYKAPPPKERLEMEYAPGGTIAALKAERDSYFAEVESLHLENDKLREALSISRGQWIHSVNAFQCLEALGEEVPPCHVPDCVCGRWKE